MTPTTRRRQKNPLDHEPEAVWRARRRLRLTQRQLAERCGVSKSLITEIENGTRNATPENITKLAAALGCRPADLERRREPQTVPAADVDVLGMQGGERSIPDDLPEREPAPAATTAKEVK